MFLTPESSEVPVIPQSRSKVRDSADPPGQNRIKVRLGTLQVHQGKIGLRIGQGLCGLTGRNRVKVRLRTLHAAPTGQNRVKVKSGTLQISQSKPGLRLSGDSADPPGNIG